MRSRLTSKVRHHFSKLTDDQGNVESFMVLIPLTLLAMALLSLMLFVQTRVVMLGILVSITREASLSSDYENMGTGATVRMERALPGLSNVRVNFVDRMISGELATEVIAEGDFPMGFFSHVRVALLTLKEG